MSLSSENETMLRHIFLSIILWFSLVGHVSAQEPNWSDYAQLLKRYVSIGVRHETHLAQVDYRAIRADALWPRVVELIEDYPLERLTSREERLSFYINAYNILAIKMVVDHWPLESIKDVGGFFTPVWKIGVGHLGGREVTLDEIEHRILRPMGEPRIHLAIVCASVSCPDLRAEPYTAATLAQQLDEQSRRFLNNTAKGLRVEDGVIRVSKIFDWFEDDFSELGGVELFLRRHRAGLPPGLPWRADIPYDWRLNSTESES